MTFNIPVILLKNLVILPNQEIKLELKNVISGKAINESSSNFKGVSKYFQEVNSDILYSEVMYIDLPSLVPEEENAILKKLVSVLKEYINVSKTVSNDILTFVSSNKDLNKITDAITSFLPFNITKKLEYMEEINPIKRAKSLIKDMYEEIKVAEIDNELEEKVDESFQNDQRE